MTLTEPAPLGTLYLAIQEIRSPVCRKAQWMDPTNAVAATFHSLSVLQIAIIIINIFYVPTLE